MRHVNLCALVAVLCLAAVNLHAGTTADVVLDGIINFNSQRGPNEEEPDSRATGYLRVTHKGERFTARLLLEGRTESDHEDVIREAYAGIRFKRGGGGSVVFVRVPHFSTLLEPLIVQDVAALPALPVARYGYGAKLELRDINGLRLNIALTGRSGLKFEEVASKLAAGEVLRDGTLPFTHAQDSSDWAELSVYGRKSLSESLTFGLGAHLGAKSDSDVVFSRYVTDFSWKPRWWMTLRGVGFYGIESIGEEHPEISGAYLVGQVWPHEFISFQGRAEYYDFDDLGEIAPWRAGISVGEKLGWWLATVEYSHEDRVLSHPTIERLSLRLRFVWGTQ